MAQLGGPRRRVLQDRSRRVSHDTPMGRCLRTFLACSQKVGPYKLIFVRLEKTSSTFPREDYRAIIYPARD